MTVQSAYETRFPSTELGERGRVAAKPRETSEDGERGHALARGLGLFSLGLGLLEVAAPRRVAKLIGVRADADHMRALRAAGLREITSGLGILGQVDPKGWLWARVGGDVSDLALLAGALKEPDSKRDRVLLAAAAVLGVTVLDVIASNRARPRIDDGAYSTRAGQRTRESSGALGKVTRLLTSGQSSGIHVHKAITINRSVEEVYRFWRNFENLPRFMSHLESVSVTSERASQWVAKGPAGSTIRWDAEMTEDVPNQRIAWASLANADIENSGSVRFNKAPGKRGTEVHVALSYKPPAGKMGAIVAKLFGEAPDQQVQADLRHFKQMMELGEVAHSDASIHRGPHPGRPADNTNALGRGE